MEINKEIVLAMESDFVATLGDVEFKKSLLEAKNNPNVLQNPMALMGLVLPKLSVILQKHGLTEPHAPQQFIVFLLMNQSDPALKNFVEKLQNALMNASQD